MTKLISALRRSGAAACAAAVAVLRALTTAKVQEGDIPYAVYVLLASGGLLLLWDSLTRRHYAPAFTRGGRFRVYPFCFAAAAGFFAEFVLYCHLIYQSVENGVYHLFAAFAPLCLVCFGALFSGFYCGAMGVSFATDRYDFRRLRLMHLMPVLWAGGHILQLLTVNDVLQPHTVLRYAAMAAALLFFFFLVIEVERGAGAMGLTVFLARAFFWLTALYGCDTVILLLAGRVALLSTDTELAAAMVLIGSFALFFSLNILSNTKTSTESH